ncbi:MAG: SemiSWEET transporter [Thermostichus sp. DG_1_6_bins_120]
MNLTLWIGLLAATLTTSSFLPQALKTWRSQRADDFSWSYLLLFGIGILMWDVYGWLRQDAAIVIANSMTLALLSVIIFTKYRTER